jgi:anti-sigma B factor antagonist
MLNPASDTETRRQAPTRTRQLSSGPAGRGGRSSDIEATLASSLRPRGPAQLELIERDRGDETYLLAQGEVDVLTAPKLAGALVRILHTARGDVVVDLNDTLFIDSAGLHVLLNVQRRLTRRGRKLQVICGSGPVRRVIELARLVDTLNVVDEQRRRSQGAHGAIQAQLPARGGPSAHPPGLPGRR